MDKHDDHFLDKDVNSELRAMEIFVEGYRSSGDENAMDVNGQLGFERSDVNIGVDDVHQNDEDTSSPSLSVRASPQDSPDSRASTNVRSDQMNRASDLLMAVSVSADTNKTRITDLASSAMEELLKMALEGEPLWHIDGDSESLNGFEYMKEFGSVDATLREIMRMVEVGDPQCLPNLEPNDESPSECTDRPMLPKELEEEHLHAEASRQIGLVSANPASVVEWLMDVNQWSLVFANIISRANLLQVLSTGVDGNYDGTLQLMTVELHLPTALVPTRESHFVRYCKQLGYGTWGVVDVSLENLFPYPASRFRRRPSGCLIQGMPEGCSKVIWVEHVAVDNRLVQSIYRPLVISGFTFSAKRWFAALIRHCQWLATLRARTAPTHDGVLLPQAGRESLLKLAEKMTRSFWGDISACNENQWMPLPIRGAEDIRAMTKGSIPVPGMPPSSKIVFTTSIRLAVPPKRLFDFLRDENSRTKWDTRLFGHIIRELAYVINGNNPENRVSILQVNATPEEVEIFYLQESFSDDIGSYVIYAPVDAPAMSGILNGGSPEIVNILPCGFSILPDRPPLNGHGDVPGSLLTIAFHIIDLASTEEYIPPESVKTIFKVIAETAFLIKAAFTSDNVQGNLAGG